MPRVKMKVDKSYFCFTLTQSLQIKNRICIGARNEKIHRKPTISNIVILKYAPFKSTLFECASRRNIKHVNDKKIYNETK